MQLEAGIVGVRVFINVIDALGVKQRGTALDAADFLAFGQKKLSEVGAVLAGDAGDEGLLGHV
jgi:hypothetical protein